MKIGAMTCACVLALVFSSFSQNDPRSIAGAVLGKNFYYQSTETKHDTIGWLLVGSSLTPDIDSGRVYKLKNPSAMSLFILDRLGYGIFALSRWQCITRLALKVNNKDMPDRFAKQGIMTDVLWESVDHVTRISEEQPRKALIRIHFKDGGFAEMDEKETPSSSTRQLFGATGLVVRYRIEGMPSQTEQAQTQTIYRDFFGLYFVAEAAKTSKQVVSEIEKEMDRLHLDLSYKVPEWAEAKGPWIGKGTEPR